MRALRSQPVHEDPPLGSAARPTLGYQPALDGLRGLALIAIFLYHSQLQVTPGAFLSVSTFFTLSGFLITTILLAEHERTGTVSLRTFWSRRLRRLMPAAVATVGLITVAGVALADSTQLVRLRADALSSLLYVANWRFIAVGDTYGAGFASPSPFTHFWTLAIEEQLYMVLPVVIVLAVRLGNGSRRVGGGVLAAIAVGTIVWANWLVHSGASTNRLYFGTDIRATELISGALLAVWWGRRATPIGPAAGKVLSIAGPLALAAMVGAWAVADLQQRWFYRGGLTLYTLLTLTVILAAIEPGGLVRRVLSWRPLVWIGVVSYGGYLLHFPILLWLDQHLDLAAWAQIALALPLTFGLAALSARYLERPIRTGRLVSAGRGGATTIAAVTATVVVVLVSTALAPTPNSTDLEAALRWQRFMQQSAAQDASTAPRIALFGDSTALMTSRGLSEVSRDQPDEFVAGAGWANLGCGLFDRGVRRSKDVVAPVPADCRNWSEQWRAASTARPSDLAVVQLGPWEVTDQSLTPDGQLQSIEDEEVFAQLNAKLREGVAALLEQNTYVVLIAPPDIEVGRVDGNPPDRPFDESKPDRMARYRNMVAQVAASDDRVEVIRLDRWVTTRPDEPTLRPDGVHFSNTAAITAAKWLGPELVGVYERRSGRATSGVLDR